MSTEAAFIEFDCPSIKRHLSYSKEFCSFLQIWKDTGGFARFLEKSHELGALDKFTLQGLTSARDQIRGGKRKSETFNQSYLGLVAPSEASESEKVERILPGPNGLTLTDSVSSEKLTKAKAPSAEAPPKVLPRKPSGYSRPARNRGLLRENDFDRLKLIHKADGRPKTFASWAQLLGYKTGAASSAEKWMKTKESQRRLVLAVTANGISAVLTAKAAREIGIS